MIDNFSKVKGTPVDYVPTKTGNVLNKNEFILDKNYTTFYIDYEGNAINLGNPLTWRSVAETLIEHLNLVTQLKDKAPIDSPEFTGIAKSITSDILDNSNTIATTEFVNNVLNKFQLKNTNIDISKKVFKTLELLDSNNVIELNLGNFIFKYTSLIFSHKLDIKLSDTVLDNIYICIDSNNYTITSEYQPIGIENVDKNKSIWYEIITTNNIYIITITNFNDISVHVSVEKYN